MVLKLFVFLQKNGQNLLNFIFYMSTCSLHNLRSVNISDLCAKLLSLFLLFVLNLLSFYGVALFSPLVCTRTIHFSVPYKINNIVSAHDRKVVGLNPVTSILDGSGVKATQV